MQDNDISKNTSLAEVVLDGSMSPYFFPIALWFACEEAQIYLSKLVDIPTTDWFYIIQFTHGARVLSILYFGFRGFISLLMMPLFYFYVLSLPSLNASDFSVLPLMTLQTFAVWITYEAVKKYRKLDVDLYGIRTLDIYLVIIASSLITAFFIPPYASTSENMSKEVLIGFNFMGKVVGGIIIYYACMFLFAMLDKINVQQKSRP